MKSKKVQLHVLMLVIVLVVVGVTVNSKLTKNDKYEVSIVENSFETNNVAIEINEYEEYEKYLTIYSDYFNLKSDKVIELAHKLTNDFTQEYNMKLNGNTYNFSNPEQGSLVFVYKLYKGKLNVKVSDYKIKRKTRTLKKQNKKLYVSNGYTFSEMLGHISDLLNVDKSLALAISNHETGNQKSSLSMKSNNFGGLRGSKGYMKFETPESGIVYYVVTLGSIINKNNIKDIRSLSGIYVNGKKSKPSETWIKAVNSFKNKINKNPSKYFKEV